MAEKIILLDSNSIVHRAYHALPNLKSSKGMHTGAIFGFLTILLRLIKEQQPTHIAAAFDLKGPTFRHNMYEAYKGTRKPMDEELREQIEPLKELLRAMGIKIVSKEGYEADDILGTLAARFKGDTIIVTGDRDSFQLVSPSTKIFWTKKGVSDIEIYDEARLMQDGFSVASYIDYKALRGDASDNIPGIAGVGEKTAKQLLETYGSLDNILEHAGEIRGKIGETISKSKDIALLSRKLSVIDTDVPVECTLEEIEFNPVFSPDVRNMLAELEITSLANRMTFAACGKDAVAKSQVNKEIVEIRDLSEIEKIVRGDKIALLTDNGLRFAFDERTEYTLGAAKGAQPVQLSFFSDEEYIPETDKAVELLSRLCADMELVCFDFKSLSKRYGFGNAKFFDLMIAAHLARDSAPIKNIETVLGSEGLETGAVEMLIARDKLEDVLSQKGLQGIFYDVEQPLAVVLRNMETRGFRISATVLKRLELKYGEKISELTASIYELAGCTFNIASPKQLGDILFENLGLKHGKKTKTGYSVGEDVLQKLLCEHPIVALILNWRHYSKLQSTYVLGLQALIENGRIHTEFKQCITATGRLSSTNPNLQNIPARGEEAKDIKSAFIPSEGNVLVSADYSQIELRLLADMSGDDKLIEAYRRADDIHALTASQILGVPIEEVTPQQRRDAKAVNFGIVYGISDFGLAENLSIPKYKAKQFIESYFQTYPTVKKFLENNVEKARERGYSETMLGRRRELSDLRASNYLLRSSAERMAMNTPLQGSAADIVKLAMLKVEKRLENMKSKMILQVHDELIIDADRNEADIVKRILTEEMENVVSLRVPLVAEACSAEDWGCLK